MKRILLLICSAISFAANATEYKIHSAVELQTLKLAPGDKVVLADGQWKDQRLVFSGKGTEAAPIVLTTEKPGVTKLTGTSTLLVEGTWLVVDGLYFTDGHSEKEDVIVLSAKTSYSRVTNTAIVNYNAPDIKKDYKWLSLYGHHNRVDHCWLEGKSHQGTTLVVWLSDQPNYHRIDHNYFGQRPELGVNGGETIRIGTSTWSMHDSYTIVENNIFNRCDGEIEAISNKSCRNILRNNLFYECSATLTLRHGNNNEAYGNIFIGNNKPNTGGIRIIGENQQVHDNFFQELTGTGLSAAISIMDGLPNPILTSHWQVKNAVISKNTIVHCKESLSIGAGKNADRYLPALNTVFNNNTIITDRQPVNWVDESVVMQFSGNIADVPAGTKLPEGFAVKATGTAKDKDGIWQVPGVKPDLFWKNTKVGPAWTSPVLGAR